MKRESMPSALSCLILLIKWPRKWAPPSSSSSPPSTSYSNAQLFIFCICICILHKIHRPEYQICHWKYQAPNSRNTKQTIPNTKYTIPNAKYTIQNATHTLDGLAPWFCKHHFVIFVHLWPILWKGKAEKRENWAMHRILHFDEHIIAQFQNGTDMKIWTDGISNWKKKEVEYDKT